MSPTLLELVVGLLLLWLAWQIGSWLAPQVLASCIAFWRNGNKTTAAPVPPRTEKNITPPSAAAGETPSQTHANLRK